MTIAMQPIYTQTVGAGGAAGITFNNIPQTFTDLYLVFSARTNATPSNTTTRVRIGYNNQGAIGSVRVIEGNGSSINNFAEGNATVMVAGYANTATAGVNIFSSGEIYVPNYAGTNFKQVIANGVAEGNAATLSYGGLTMSAALYPSSSPITIVNISVEQGSFVQYSTFTLYGITKG